MPELIKLYIRSIVLGFALAAVFVALLMWTNVGNLSALIANSDDGPLALVLLFVLHGLVFAGAQMAVAVWLMHDDVDGGTGGLGTDQPDVPVALQSDRS